jgi:hypothetical protein
MEYRNAVRLDAQSILREGTYNAETEVYFPNLTVGKTLSLLLRLAFLGTESRASLETYIQNTCEMFSWLYLPFTH